jgi:hypothetical protein
MYLSINIENCKTNRIYSKVFFIEKIKIENSKRYIRTMKKYAKKCLITLVKILKLERLKINNE